MTEQSERESLPNLHPIQLIDVKVRKLFVELNTPLIDSIKVEINNFSFSHGHSPYDQESKQFIVFARPQVNVEDDVEGEVSEDDNKSLLQMTVELAGFFQVDESRFPIASVEKFAKSNAPLIIYPFLREHTYGLLSRVGINGIVLPLFQVPSVTLERK